MQQNIKMEYVILFVMLFITIVTGQACVGKYQRYSNMNVFGGKDRAFTQPNLPTLANCVTACDAQSTCYGFDYQKSPLRCYFFTAPITYTRHANTNADHYLKSQQCGIATTTKPTTIPTTAQPGECVDTFTRNQNKRSTSGAQVQRGVTTRSDCERRCKASTTTCSGYQVKTSGTFACDIFYADNKNSLTASTSIDYYIRNICGECVDTFTRNQNKRSTIGAQVQTGATSQSDCESRCKASATTCYGYQVKTSGTFACDIFYADNRNSLTASNSIDYYLRNICGRVKDGCVDGFIFTMFTKTNYLHGAEQVSFKTLGSCQAGCRTNSLCLGLDWTGTRCFLHLVKLKYTDANKRTTNGVTHYRKDICPDSVCYVTHERRRYNGASQDTSSGSNTIEGCTLICSRNVACIGLNYNTLNNQCWIHKTALTGNGVADTSFTHKRKSECADCYVVADDRYVQGGTLVTTANAIVKCQTKCTASRKCLAFDYYEETASCYIQTVTTNFKNLQNNARRQHHRRESCQLAECFTTVSKKTYEKHSAESLGVTITECRQQCRDRDDCYAASYQFSSDKCFFHSQADAKNEIAGTSRDLYKKAVLCQPSCMFTMKDYYIPQDGRKIPDVSSKQACYNACKADVTCKGADFKPSTNACIGHRTDSYFNSESAETNSMHFRKENCKVTGCFLSLFGHTYDAHKTQKDSVSADGCRELCNDDEACAAASYDVTSNKCLLHTEGQLSIGQLSANIHRMVFVKRDHCRKKCYDKYDVTPGYYYDGASRQVALTSLEACELVCDMHVDCVGFVFTTTKHCSFHTNVADFSSQRKSGATYTTYKKKECMKDCFTSVIKIENKRYNGGTMVSASTLAYCYVACFTTTTCVGFDYNNANHCYLHKNVAYFVTGFDDRNVNHYRITKCDKVCAKDWVREPGAFFSNGVGGYNPTTENECINHCAVTDDCLGVDYFSSRRNCVMHLNANELKVKQSSSNSVHNRKPSCDTYCLSEFTVLAARKYTGGVYHASLSTEGACRQACAVDSACVAFGWSISRRRCDLHFSLPAASLVSTTDTHLYTKTDCAPSCEPGYAISSQRRALAGTRTADVNLQDCLNRCTLASKCLAVDFTTSKECYQHMSYNQLDALRESATTNHYRKVACSKSCDLFVKSALHQMAGATVQKIGIKSPEGCRTICAQYDGCYGLNYDRRTSRCFLFTSFTGIHSPGALVAQTTYDFYRRRPCAKVCEVGFSRYARSQRVGGVTLTGVPQMTAATCQKACLTTYKCVAFSIKLSSAECQLFTDIKSKGLIDSTNYDHYIMKDCRYFNASDSLNPSACTDRYVLRYNGEAGIGGKSRSDVTTLEECQAACNLDRGCTHLDWNTAALVSSNEAKCYLFINVKTMRYRPKSGIDHYKRITCDAKMPTTKCITTFSKKANTRYASAVKQISSHTDKDTCQANCEAQIKNNCLAFEYKRDTDECFFHSNSANIQGRGFLDLNRDFYNRIETCVAVKGNSRASLQMPHPLVVMALLLLVILT